MHLIRYTVINKGVNMISVIIPTYKGSRFLSRAIDSVLLQDDVDFEIIVVDDNSPQSVERKKTEQVMKKYSASSNIRYIKHTQNFNGSVARNTGLKIANGQYISFLDDDDFYLPNRLSICLKEIQNSKADMVYTDTLIIGNGLKYISASETGNLFEKLLVNDNLIGTGSNLFFDRKITDQFGGFKEDLVRHQDYEFLLRMFSHGALAHAINKCLVVKATNGTNNQANYPVFKRVKEELGKEFRNDINKLPKSLINEIFIYQHQQLLWTALNDDDRAGILTEKNKLKKLGTVDSKFFLKKLAKDMHVFSVLRKILEHRRYEEIRKYHKQEYVYAKDYMQKYI